MHLAVRLLQRQQLGRRTRKLRPLFPPMGIEYQRAAVAYARACESIIRSELLAKLPYMLDQQLAPTTRADDLGQRAVPLRSWLALREASGPSALRCLRSLGA